MASVKLLLRPDRANSKNEHPLWLRITKNRKCKYTSLDIYLFPDQWDADKQRVKKNRANSMRLNSYLARKVAEAEEVGLSLETGGKHISTLRNKDVSIGKGSPDFFQFADTFVNNLKLREKIGSYRRSKSVIQKLRDFVNGKVLPLDEITVTFLREYEAFLAVHFQNRINTIHANFRLIRTIINNAIREDLLPADLNPFLKFRLKAEQTQRAYLTEEELNRIDSLDLDINSMLHHHRNVYVFSAYAGGLRISDVLQLRWENFDGQKVCIRIHKTQTPLSIKLPNRALEIIRFYKKGNCDSNDFIFPLLKLQPDEENPRRLHNAISSATAYTNKDLKKLAHLAKIEKHVSFHSSRHTWATRALTLGMRIEHVSKLMGHSAIKETQIYAKIVNKELDQAMAVFN